MFQDIVRDPGNKVSVEARKKSSANAVCCGSASNKPSQSKCQYECLSRTSGALYGNVDTAIIQCPFLLRCEHVRDATEILKEI
jgi:hypothetical protein